MSGQADPVLRRLAFLLRHAPGLRQVPINRHGYVPVTVILRKLRLAPSELAELVGQGQGRYQYSPDLQSLRAMGGHSSATEVLLAPGWLDDFAVVPTTLYLRLPRHLLVTALTQGLTTDRRFVFSEVATTPRRNMVVLQLDTAAAQAAGVTFYGGGYLTYTHGLMGQLRPEWLRLVGIYQRVATALPVSVLPRSLQLYLLVAV